MENNNVLDLEKQKKNKEELQKKLIEEHKSRLNKVFSTEEGRYALKQMAINSGFFNPNVEIQHKNALFYQMGKKKMFLDTFSFLDNEIKKKLIDDIYNNEV